MYGLPHTTEIRKQLPKKAIYAKFELKPAQRDGFDADVSRIDIVAVVSPTTVPAIAAGESIKEFYVLAVQLKRKDYDEKNIAMLSKLIPQNILFALQYEGQTQLAIYHTKLIRSDWKPTDETSISLIGLNLRFDFLLLFIIRNLLRQSLSLLHLNLTNRLDDILPYGIEIQSNKAD